MKRCENPTVKRWSYIALPSFIGSDDTLRRLFKEQEVSIWENERIRAMIQAIKDNLD